MTNKYLGVDLALNHSGFVELDQDGKMSWWTFVSSTKGHSKEHGEFMPHAKTPGQEREDVNAHRLAWWANFLPALIWSRDPTHVGIEDYAMQADSNSAYQIGEVGGLARLAVLLAGRKPKLRLHDPLSIKMYAAHHGSAKPETVMMAVYERWPETRVWQSLAIVPQIDLAVAYVIAVMVYNEERLRAGLVKLSDFDQKEIQVFNRVTKSNPTNLLDRNWVAL